MAADAPTTPGRPAATGGNARTDSADFLCFTAARCATDVPGDWVSARVNLPKDNAPHHSRDNWHAGGVRFIGSTYFNLDFSLNYMYLNYTFANGNTVSDFSNYGADLDGNGFIDVTEGEGSGQRSDQRGLLWQAVRDRPVWPQLEGRNAVAWEPRGAHVLLFWQWWWRELKSLPLDISFTRGRCSTPLPAATSSGLKRPTTSSRKH